MAHLFGVSFKCGQFPLAVMKAAPDRGPDILVLGVGHMRERQEFGAGGLVHVEGAKDAVNINDARQQAGVLDPADLGLGHMAALGQALPGQPRGTTQVTQSAGKALPVMTCLLWVESHSSSVTYFS